MSGAISCLSLYHVCPAHSRKSVGTAVFHFHPQMGEVSRLESSFNFFHWVFHRFCEKEAGFPTVFSTFSTEFSTKNRASGYTRCIQEREMREKLGRKGVEAPFFQKKVEVKNLFSEAFRTREENGSPLWNFWPRSFPQACPGKTSLWKTVGRPEASASFAGKTKCAPGAGRPAEALECWKIYTAP